MLPPAKRQVHEAVTGGLGLSTMPQDRLLDVTGAAVVQVACVVVDGLKQPDPPQGWGAPLATGGTEDRQPIGQFGPHIVQQQVGVGADRLPRERSDRVLTSHEMLRVASGAADLVEEPLPRQHGRVVGCPLHRTASTLA